MLKIKLPFFIRIFWFAGFWQTNKRLKGEIVFMGVSLSELVKGRELELDELKGKAIAIDAYNTIYQFLSTIRDRFTGEPLRDSKGRVTSHLSGLFYRTSKLLEAGTAPVFVFDGKPPEFKKKTIEERMKIRKKAEVKWKQALKEGDIEKVRLYSQGALRLTEEMALEAKKLLGYMGVSWVQAPSEGEAQAVHMLKKKQVWAIGSQDWDSLLFGAERMVKNLAITGRRKLPGKEKYIEVKPELIELKTVLEGLGISQEQLILLGILVGTDYNPGGVKGVGPKTALKLVKENMGFEVFKKVEWKFEPSPESIFEFFKNPPAKDIGIEKQKLVPEKLLDFMAEEHDFSRERVESSVKKLEKSREERKQKGLYGFFGKKS